MPAPAWNDIIDLAFGDLEATQPSEVLSTAIRTDAQTRLNLLISSLNTEGFTIFNQVLQSFVLSPGVGSYTLGSGGSFGTTGGLRAQKVTSWSANYLDMRKGGSVLSMAEFFAAAQAKQEALSDLYRQAVMEGVIAAFPSTIGAPVPSVVGADTSYPLINVRISPIPSGAAGSLELAYWTPIAQIADFTLVPTLPEGWADMLHFNLAVQLAPRYARDHGITAELASNAQNSKARLVQQNSMGAPAPAQPQQQ